MKRACTLVSVVNTYEANGFSLQKQDTPIKYKARRSEMRFRKKKVKRVGRGAY